MMSHVGHNVHNVTPRLLIMVEKALTLYVDCAIIHTFVKISMLSILYDYVIVFTTFFASHITRPPSKYDVL